MSEWWTAVGRSVCSVSEYSEVEAGAVTLATLVSGPVTPMVLQQRSNAVVRELPISGLLTDVDDVPDNMTSF